MNYNKMLQAAQEERQICKAAQQKIMSATGRSISIMLLPEYMGTRTPQLMLTVIANALNMDVACYKHRSRKRNYVELRFIAAYLLRKFFPNLTLADITILFGGMNHTTIINGIERVAELIATNNELFTAKYETALNSVNIWLRKEVSGFASAISA